MTNRLSNRRGAILVLAAFVMVVVLGMLVVVVDMSRMYTQKNELQTAADAGALAGVIGLLTGDSEADIKAAAVTYGQKNQVLKQNITVSAADVVCGIWDESTKTYLGDEAQCTAAQNTVAVTTRGAANYTFPNFMGGNKQLVATARAFVANVGETTCIKPWAIPYARLTKLLQPLNDDSLRNLTALDLQLMAEMSVAQRTFLLKIGSPPASGNFGSLSIPDAQDPNANGGALYKSNIVKCNSTPIGPGTELSTETGGMVGPTKAGIEEFCESNGTFNKSTGDCNEAGFVTGGETGIVVKAALWSQLTNKGSGNYSIVVRQIVAFRLDNVSKDAEVRGHFLPIVTNGGITSLNTTIKRPILVK